MMRSWIISLAISTFMSLSTAHAADLNASDKTLMQGRVFLEETSKKPGIIRLDSGLEYQIVQPGNAQAASPGPTDFVTVNYRGTLIDGTEFDSSYARNQPATFAVNAVIPGWTEALQLMKPGAKWIIYVPTELAYGATGAGAVIPPNSALIFEIELLSVQSAFDEDDATDPVLPAEEEG